MRFSPASSFFSLVFRLLSFSRLILSLFSASRSIVSGRRSPVYGFRSLFSLPCLLSAKRYSLNAVLFFSFLGLFTLFPAPCPLSPENAYADFSINPSIAVSEEYNDNVFEEHDRKTDYITRLMPGVSLTYVMPFWDWNVAYNYDYRIYAKNSRSNEDTHYLLATGLLRLIDEFLFLDINDNYSRVSLDVSRDRTQEGLVSGQSDTNIFSASPYLQFNPTNQTTIRTGYRYRNVWYKDPSGIDRRDHIGYIDAAYAYSSRLTLNANHTYTHENSIYPFDRHVSYIGGRYEYGPRSFILAQGGMAFTDSKHGGNINKPYWNVGITHSFDHILISMTSQTLYPIDPTTPDTREVANSLTITKELRRGTIGLNLSYSEYSGTGIDVDKSYGAGITAGYDLTPNLRGAIICRADKYEHRITDSYTRRIFVNPSLTYALPREFAVALNYVFVDSYSPATRIDRYQANRVSLELRKSFGREVERLRRPDQEPATAERIR